MFPKDYTNFSGVYLAVGFAGLSALVTALPFLRKRKDVPKANNAGRVSFRNMVGGWGRIARTRGVFVVSLIEAGQYYTYGVVESFFVTYMTYVANMEGILQSIILFSLIFTVMFSKPLVGKLSDRAGRRKPIILGCVVSAVPLVAVPFFTQFPVLLVLSMIYGLGFSTVTSVTPALVSELVPIEVVGGAMGFMSTLMDIGQTFGPIVSGFILGTFLGYVGVFSSLALVLLLTVAAFARFKLSEPHVGDRT